VIPARNAAHTIGSQLEALANQDYPGPLEVVVADNNSSDDTTAVVLRWTDRLPGLRVVRADERWSPGYARNVAVSAATNEFVLMCDSDDVVHRSWAGRLVNALRGAPAVAGGFARLDGTPADVSQVFPFVSGFRFLPGFSTASAGVTRTAWQDVGGFDEDLPTGEDLDFAWRLQLAGFALVSCPDAFVYYGAPTTRAARLRRSYRYGLLQPVLFARYRSAGMARQPVVKSVARWAVLLASCYRLFGSADDRLAYCDDVGKRFGRLVGSVRARSLFL
jgi:glycosyltransferase involved in cell wall biosynthesis